MVLTRNEAKSTFAHVMDNVLGRKDGSALKASLVDEGIDDIFLLMSLDEGIIDGLKFKDQADGDTLKPIRLSDKMLLKCFLHFITNKDLEGNPINDHDWTKVTQEEFDEFRISPSYIATRTPNALSLPATRKTGPNTSPNPSSYSPADIFRRGIKKDASLFPVLKDESSMTVGIVLLSTKLEHKILVKCLIQHINQGYPVKKNYSSRNRSLYMPSLSPRYLLTEEKQLSENMKIHLMLKQSTRSLLIII
jgi:hypothetical protein